jgi:hypothetical protein
MFYAEFIFKAIQSIFDAHKCNRITSKEFKRITGNILGTTPNKLALELTISIIFTKS